MYRDAHDKESTKVEYKEDAVSKLKEKGCVKNTFKSKLCLTLTL
jgi:hypothetical protein